MTEPRRIIELDGLRGIACLAVVAAHYLGEVQHGFRLFALGWAGVDLFFCLSGFLIGGILLDNQDKDAKSYFGTFYIRRVFRIFPIYYATILITLLFVYWQPHRTWVDPTLPAVSYLTFTQNFILAISGGEANRWLLPTWTLCVEEQFYLILPAILFFVPRQYLARVLVGLVVSASLFRLALALTVSGKLATYVLLPSRWDLLFLGVLGAYALRHYDVWRGLIARNRRWLKVAILSSIAMAPALAVIDKYLQFRGFEIFGPLFIGIAFTGYLLLVVSGSPEGARLRSKVLRFFGEISYALYLVHQPVSGIMHGLILDARPDVGSWAQFAVTLAAFAVSIGIARLSWVYFERPLLRIGQSWKYGKSAPTRIAATA